MNQKGQLRNEADQVFRAASPRSIPGSLFRMIDRQDEESLSIRYIVFHSNVLYVRKQLQLPVVAFTQMAFDTAAAGHPPRQPGLAARRPFRIRPVRYTQL